MDSARLPSLRYWVLGAGFVTVAALFWVYRIVRPGSELDLMITDLFLYYLPSYEILYGSLLSGRIPLWNPYQICGTPMLASLQAGFFYPGHLVYLFLPVETGFVVSCVLHLAGIAFSMWLLVRRLGLGMGAAVAAALFLALRGRYPGMVFFPNMLEAAAWLPLGAVGIVGIVRRGDLRSALCVALCTGMSLLAGYPQVTVYTVYSWGALLAILSLLDRRDARHWLRGSALLGLGLCLGAALAAAQLLPTWELTAQGTRSAEVLTRAEQFPMKWHGSGPWGILRTLKAPFPQLAFSFGWVAIAALVTAFFAKAHRALALACLGMAVVVALFAMGPVTPVFDWISALPALGWFRFPRRSLFMLDFFTGIVFATGVHWWITRATDRLGTTTSRLAIAAAWLPALLLGVEVFRAPPNAADLQRALDAMRHYGDSSPIYDRVAESGERVWIRSPNIHPPLPKLASYRRVRSVGDYEPLNQRRQSDYFTYLTEGRLTPKLEGQPYSGRLKHLTEPVYPGALLARGHLLDVAAVRWFVLQRMALRMPEIDAWVAERGLVEEDGDANTVLLRNPHALPRAYTVYDVQPAPEPLALMQTLADPDFDPLARSYAEGVAARPPVSRRGDAARIVVDEATRVEVEAELAADGMLVLVDSVYPGWQASVDGEPVEILPANHLFRGVLLPAGRHRVVFRYRPWTVPVGAAVSGLAAIAIAGLWVHARRTDELPVSGPDVSIPRSDFPVQQDRA